MENNQWLDDKYVKEWLTGLSELSVRNYQKEFRKWLDFIGMSPTEQIEKRLKDIASSNPRVRAWFERKVVEYKVKLEGEDYAKNTIEKNYLRTVQSFFSRNRLPLKFKRGELTVERRSKVEKTWIPNNEEIRVMYSAANLRDRALMLVLYHSGFSEIDVSGMNIEDFEFYDKDGNWQITEDTHLYVKRFREKTDIEQSTCISSEALENIRLMLQARDFPKTGALFISHKNRRLGVRFIHEIMKKICETALPEHAKEFKTKSFRDTYHDSLARANIAERVQKRMFGHKPHGAEASYHVSEATTREAYHKAFRYMSINHARAEREIIQKQTARLDLLASQNSALQQAIKVLTEALNKGGFIPKEAHKKALELIGA